jgi:hypothetical protein
MATLLKANVPRRRSTERRPVVTLTLAVLMAAGALIMLGRPDGGGVPAVSVNAAEAVEDLDATELLLQSSPAQTYPDSAPAQASGCSANGISGDMIGDASPHEIYETYITWCRGQ